MNSSFFPAEVVLAVIATYVAHSTLLLSAAWLIHRVWKGGLGFHERLWKYAAVLGLITAPIQVGLVSPRPVIEWTLAASPWRAESIGPRLRAASALNGDAGRFRPSRPVPAPPEPPGEAAPPVGRGTAGREPESAVSAGTAVLRVPVVQVPVVRRGPVVEEAGVHRSATPQPVVRAERVGVETRSPRGGRPRAVETALQWGANGLVFLMFAGVVRSVVQAMMLGRRFASAIELTSGPARCELDRFLARHGIRARVRLLVTAACAEPLSFGFWRWTIVLPAATESRLASSELRALLAHEVAHLVRGDVWWLWLGRLLCCCLPIQPLNFVARRRWQQAAEFLCDDWATRRGIPPLALARCLTQIAEWRFGEAVTAGALAAAGNRATLVCRVRRLVRSAPSGAREEGRGGRWLAFACALTVAVVAVWFAPRVVYSNPDSNGRAAATSRAAASRAAAGPPRALSNQGTALDASLDALQADLRKLDRLMDRLPDDPVLRRLAATVRRRATLIESRHPLLSAESLTGD